MKDSKIDYTNLNDRIVEQAWQSVFPTVLTEEDKTKLINEKIERARLQREAFYKFQPEA